MIPDFNYYNKLLKMFWKFTREVNLTLMDKKYDKKECVFTLKVLVFEFQAELNEMNENWLEFQIFSSKKLPSNKELFVRVKTRSIKVQYCVN